MARDYIDIGPSPCDEPCEQLGENYNPKKARFECQLFISQLRREFGNEPEGAELRIKSNPHEYGTYLNVVCYYDTNNEEAANYAFNCESSAEKWDREAKYSLMVWNNRQEANL